MTQEAVMEKGHTRDRVTPLSFETPVYKKSREYRIDPDLVLKTGGSASIPTRLKLNIIKF